MRRQATLTTRILALQKAWRSAGEIDLRRSAKALAYRAQSGESLRSLMPETFALAREAARRAVGMEHFEVQIAGGVALARGRIAEMQTGEGKTLTATLPLSLFALAGNGALLATANDYLAQRDANWMRPVYELLGLSVGVIQTQSSPAQRRAAYACDITYGTASEFGFDFLRDRLAMRARIGTNRPAVDRAVRSSGRSGQLPAVSLVGRRHPPRGPRGEPGCRCSRWWKYWPGVRAALPSRSEKSRTKALTPAATASVSRKRTQENAPRNWPRPVPGRRFLKSECDDPEKIRKFFGRAEYFLWGMAF